MHLHAAGQGFWIVRLIAEFGVDVILCGSFGGETGRVVRNLITDEGVDIKWIDTSGSNGAYVHDRRSGERLETATGKRPEVERFASHVTVTPLTPGDHSLASGGRGTDAC